jgi:hypothetical protein
MHTKFFSWMSFLTLVAFLALGAVVQAQAPAAGAAPIEAVRGKIQAKRVVKEVYYTKNGDVTGARFKLENDTTFEEGVTVHTGKESSVVLQFSNGTSLNLAYESELNVEKFMIDPFPDSFDLANATQEPSSSTTNLELTKGELVGNVKKLNQGVNGAKKSTFNVRTPVGAAGIRGTTFRIVYRPSGDGRTYNFTMTTVEGNVVVTLATGSGVTAPQGVSVTDNKEIVINNVEVNTVTQQVVATTSTGQTVAVTAPPPAVDAPVAVVQQVQAVAQQLAQAAINVVITSPPVTTPVTPTTPTPPVPEPKKDPAPTPTQPTSPGPTTNEPRITGP